MEQLPLIEIAQADPAVIRCLECGAVIGSLLEYRRHRASAGGSHQVLPGQYFALCGKSDGASLAKFINLTEA